ncbi:3-dehydro-L-gulonate 2-dehydrogenase [Cesiribacter sp. SM1]|uniref:3-dehydro-L-gulonate 2-dehydrogenase n=1 Tax=Cesiribacter sp. SM1 TaxID=2861196 RepID=UPI001CD4D54E|nr:3-dehydro-L-gulonate 2-dehydrogenase [Cesiribacter sp. SM1]
MAGSQESASTQDSIRIPHQQLEETFLKILLKNNYSEADADTLAALFMQNSLEGVYTHGVNRFARFIEYTQKGWVKPQEKGVCKHSSAALEQWDGMLAPGPLNALQCTDRAMELAQKYGMGCVALANTNHWMRGGAYGWRAAKKGFVFIGWTNTIANMPAWGATENKLGNNPLVVALPYGAEAIVLDMAMSQYSYGSLEAQQLKKKALPVPGGWDQNGELSTDPDAILQTRRVVPAGYWKGAGLSLLLDLLATLLSGGLSTADISKKEAEHSVSQVFIAIDTKRLSHHQTIHQLVNTIIDDYHASQPADENSNIRYPGERVLKDREQNLQKGIPVNIRVWEEIKTML